MNKWLSEIVKAFIRAGKPGYALSVVIMRFILLLLLALLAAKPALLIAKEGTRAAIEWVKDREPRPPNIGTPTADLDLLRHGGLKSRLGLRWRRLLQWSPRRGQQTPTLADVEPTGCLMPRIRQRGHRPHF